MFRILLAALPVAAAFVFAAPADAAVLQEGFGASSSFTLNGLFVQLSPDRDTLRIDTIRAANDWNWLFRTKAGILKPGRNYVATFRCRVEEPDAARRFFHFLCRPVSAADASLDSLRHNEGGRTEFRPVTLRFRAGTEAEDYAFQIHAFRRLKGEITDFKLSEGTQDGFIPIRRNLMPAAGRNDLRIPAGAREFEVDRPDNPAGAIVDAAEFGLNPAAPDNTAALNRAIAHCRAAGAARLRVPPGTYRMTADAAVLFDGLRDFVFDGGGATFVYCKKREPNFLIRQCERVVLRNFKVDWDWEKDPLASLVEVAQAAEEFVDFRFVEYDRFPRRDLRVAIVSSFDPATRSVGVEGGFDRGFEFFAGRNRPDTEWLSGNVLRLRQKGGLGRFREGQLFRMQHYYYDMNCFVMADNRHLSLEDIDIHSCAGHAFTVGGIQQYWQFRRVNIAPPAGVPRRVITCTADHCHISRSRGFFKMENCEFSYGADDCLNAHDNTGFAERSGAHTLVTCNARQDTFRAGDPVELRNGDYSPAGFTATVREVRTVDAAAGRYELSFAEELPAPPAGGFILFNRNYGTCNLIIRNNFFHDNRARGLLLLARDVTVENNHFRHNEMGAIKIETGYTLNSWSEGYGAGNIAIRNNRFDSVNPRDVGNDGKARDIYLGVYLRTDPSTERTAYPILSDILFENNLFKDSFGLVAFISSAGNVTFRNNTFVNPTARKKPLPYRAGFHVTHSENVRIVGNRHIASPHVPDPGVSYAPDSVRDLQVYGNTVVTEQAP